MKTKFPLLFVLALSALFVAFLRAQEVSTPPAVEPGKLFIVDSRAHAFLMVTVYNRIFVGNWLEIQGKKVDGAQTISVTDSGPFGPADVKIQTKNEPTVTAKADGSWEISFKEIRP